MPLMACATWWMFHDMLNKTSFYAVDISFNLKLSDSSIVR